MRIHPRTRIVDQAERELSEAFHDIRARHELTSLEALSILHALPPRVLKYALRRERHPDDPGKPADEA